MENESRMDLGGTALDNRYVTLSYELLLIKLSRIHVLMFIVSDLDGCHVNRWTVGHVAYMYND